MLNWTPVALTVAVVVGFVLRAAPRVIFEGIAMPALAWLALRVPSINPVGRFACDVELLEIGVTPADVDDVLAEHVKGAQLPGEGQRLDGVTDYEPRR